LTEFGAWVAGPLDIQAAYSDRIAPPRLEAFDSQGEARHRVIYNSDYLACHQEAYARGVIALPYEDPNCPHLMSFAMGYLLSHSDIAIHCPVTMTGALAYVLSDIAPDKVRDAYLPELLRRDGKTLSGGTWATELHGGSDVGATQTEARADGDAWRLTGLKWFASNSGSGLNLATARPLGAPEGGKGLACYLLPDILPDGRDNAIWIRRLKDKVGTRALATGEIELRGAWALEIAGPPNGLKCMMEALEYSRVHNAMAAAGLHHRCFLEVMSWISHREAFGSVIRSYPMIQDSVLELLVEMEAGTALAFESALSFDAAFKDRSARPWLRLATALAKYRTAETAVEAARRTIEIIGGNGYTEEWPSARLYRDAMVLPVWEGPANIQALELLRLLGDRYGGSTLFLGRIAAIIGKLPPAMSAEKVDLESLRARCEAALAYLADAPEEGSGLARKLLDLLAETLAAALLLEEAAAGLDNGNARKAMIARRFLDLRLHRAPGIGAGPDPCRSNFESLVSYGAVDN
jgi:alkylation response protein AidB-like acyl-CoA dehydrogenase